VNGAPLAIARAAGLQEAREAALRARARLASGRVADAVPHLAEAVELDPARALDWLDLDGLYGRRGSRPVEEAQRFGEHAYTLLERAVERFRERGRIDLAASAMQSALAVFPGRADMRAALERTMRAIVAALPLEAWPRITVVTPSFNQAPFLERCMLSVLSQGYPNLEYIVLDGGSADGSADIIRRHADRLAFWRSGADEGHYAAVTEGFARATGDILTWINSDDLLWPWSLALAGLAFASMPQLEWLAGRRNHIDGENGLIGVTPEFPDWNHARYARRDAPSAIQQEGSFWRRGLWERAGGYVGGEWALAGDYDLWLRFMRHATLRQLEVMLGAFRAGRAEQRSILHGERYAEEVNAIGARAMAWARENVVHGGPAEVVRLAELLDAYRARGTAAGSDVAAELRRGVAMHQAGNLDGAAAAYARVLERRPAQADALNLLGVVHSTRGRPDLAVPLLERAVEADPDVPPFRCNLGQALLDTHRLPEAQGAFESALRLDARSVDAHAGLARALAWQGRPEDAAEVYERGAVASGDAGLALSGALLVPVLPRSIEDIGAWRSRIVQRLAALEGIDGRVRDPLREVDLCAFYLAYHGLPNADIQRAVAARLLRACPSLAWTAPHCERPRPARAKLRVGFLSKYLRAHSIGRTSRGLIERLDRERFEVIALCVPPLADDALAQAIRGAADGWLALPGDLAAAREAVAALELDVLFYQDIGMEPFSYFLSFARLAPVQCVSFGHPDTTGVPNMDWFVSAAGFEPEDGASHYTERLHLLRDVGTLAYYHRPALAGVAKPRAAFGLGEDARIYLCPQAAFKFHPEFDDLAARILREDPRSLLVLVDSVPAWGRLLRTRLEAALGDDARRVRWMPALSGDDFLSLVACADVMLDTPHFNGMNSTLEALAVGTPVITWPRALQRGRHGLGLLRHAGLDECIAGDARGYVDQALAVAGDPALRERIRARALAGGAALFEDAGVVRQFERFFEDAHAEARAR
jgi:predicted O-linked N-acetylglucosamine transferase (SPINDLY family)